jgi:hypothetical protein
MADLLLGAYTVAPRDLHSDGGREERWYRRLFEEPAIGGLQLRFDATLHPAGVGRLAALVAPPWQSTVTDLPGMLAALGRDPRYGLASIDDEGRRAAIVQVRTMLEEISRLRELAGPRSVTAVELHSAPLVRSGASSPARFVDSLDEIGSWEWNGVTLAVEHLEADGVGQPSGKGCLSLDEETAAVHQASGRSGRFLGQSLNWGRAAIETRDADGPRRQLRALRHAGTLVGLVFSGASPEPTPFGGAWEDVHLPVRGEGPGEEPESLLTGERIAACLAVAGPLRFLGAKAGAPAGAESMAERLASPLATLRAVDAARRP